MCNLLVGFHNCPEGQKRVGGMSFAADPVSYWLKDTEISNMSA
jgi:hypothetical protein